MIPRYLLGKRRFEKIFHVKVVETPHALRGSGYLYEHPEKRAEDLMWALKNDSIKGIICNQGGDDSYRVLPYIDPKVIHDHPKVFMGFSDIATWMAVFAYAGVRAYYGPTVLTPIAQPGKLDAYTEEAIRRTLFSNEVIGEIRPSEKNTPIDWNTTYTIKEGQEEVQYERFPDNDEIEDPKDVIPWTGIRKSQRPGYCGLRRPTLADHGDEVFSGPRYLGRFHYCTGTRKHLRQ